MYSLLSKLPAKNLQFLKHLLCVLQRVSQNSIENKMCADNLGVCIGPSLLSPATLYSSTLQSEDVSKKVPNVIAYLIENYENLMIDGSCQSASEMENINRKDSGVKEQDGLPDVNGDSPRDDSSSIDSLDRDLFLPDYNEPFSPKTSSKTKVSLTNLSRDSGLTLSDTQLYTPEEEMEDGDDATTSAEGDERSGGGDARPKNFSTPLAKSVPHLNSVSTEVKTPATKFTGIDGSCHDLVNRRRFLMDGFWSKTMSSIPCPPALVEVYQNGFGTTTPREYSGPVKLRDHKRNSRNRRLVQSSIEPLENFAGEQSVLWRSASEESLIHKYTTGSSMAYQKRPALHRKGRAPSPPKVKQNRAICNRGRRSMTHRHQPDLQALWFANQSGSMDWKRSQSTSKIDQLANPPHSMTLTQAEVNDFLGETASHSCGELHIYENTRNLRRMDALNGVSTDDYMVSPGGCKHEPPSYEEALNRRNILKRLQPPTAAFQVTEQMRQEQTSLSAKARELYEESLKIYNQTAACGGDLHRAVSVNVSPSDDTHCRISPTTPTTASPSSRRIVSRSPKLPQRHKGVALNRGVRSVAEGAHSLRFRQLPPVHVTDEQINVRAPKNGKGIALQRTWRECSDIPDDLQGSINWSVAQLRNLFVPPGNNATTSALNGIFVQSPTNPSGRCRSRAKPSLPPPYRPPPATKDTLLRDHKHFDYSESTGAEESFV